MEPRGNNQFQIQFIMDELNFSITIVLDLSFRMTVMILAEAGDFGRFKILVYVEVSFFDLSIWPAEKLLSHMEK